MIRTPKLNCSEFWILDDHAWCGDSDKCDITKCFRHLSNRIATGPCTMCNCKGTEVCPYREEKK